MNLRESARGQYCLVRVPGCCTNDVSTVVLAHFRMAGISGMGVKSPDLFGAFCCAACHTAIDSGSANWTRAELRLMHLEGMVRTQAYWVTEGFIS